MRRMNDAIRIGLACAIVGLSPPEASAGPDYGSRFAGAWSGSGHTRTNIDGTPTHVRCEASGISEGTALRIEGRCTAFGLFSRAFGARISRDAATDSYQGVYVGSRSGDSLLHGRRAGDVLSLDVIWPRTINGDDRARMVLLNRGDGRFELKVEDAEPETGAVVVLTSLEFQRR